MYDDQKYIEIQSTKNKITDYFKVLELHSGKNNGRCVISHFKN